MGGEAAADAAELISIEASLIAKMLVDARFIDSIVDRVRPEDFGEQVFGRLFSLIAHVHAGGGVANPVTLRDRLEEDEQFRDLGGAGYLARLTATPGVFAIPPSLADFVAKQAQRRRMVEGLEAALALARSPSATTEEVVTATDAALGETTAVSSTLKDYTGAEVIGAALDTHDSRESGVTCGVIREVDELVGPLGRHELAIVAGRPSMGKTMFAISYAVGAVRKGHGVLFINLEMRPAMLGARISCDMLAESPDPVAFDRWKNKSLTRDQIRRIREAQQWLARQPFAVVDTSSMTIGRLKGVVRKHKRRMAAKGQSLDLVVVDYLQLVYADNPNASRFDVVSEVSRGLKALAKEQDLAVMALAQLSRAVEQRESKRPQLSDLKESGQIEQDADAVLFLLREEYYLRQAEPRADTADHLKWQEALASCEGVIDFICPKSRNGVVGVSDGRFSGRYQAVRGRA